MHKLGMFQVLSEFPKHITSQDWLKLTETEIVFFRDNYHHFQLDKAQVGTAVLAWCNITSNDASEAGDKYNRIRLKH